MRYYAIKIKDAPSAFKAVPGAFVSGAQFCSVVNGITDPGALDIKLDITKISEAGVDAGSQSYVQIKGVSLAMVAQASKLSGCSIEVHAGMAAGLPLANTQLPYLGSNQGLILKGQIRPAFGNWEANETTLDLFLTNGGVDTTPSDPVKAGAGTDKAPKNHIHNWPKNTPMASAIKNTLSTVYPKYNLLIDISDKLKLNYHDMGYYPTLESVGQYWNSISRTILGKSIPNYPGVNLFFEGDQIKVLDGQGKASGNKKILFTDLIGQPTWISMNQISFKTILRSDIERFAIIEMPKTVALTDANSAYNEGSASNPLTFQGTFRVDNIRHIGAFRQPDGAAWNTTFRATVYGSSADKSVSSTPAPTNDSSTSAGPSSTIISSRNFANRRIRSY